jgi:hypothetical protein
MSIRQLTNSSYLDADWQDEITSKNALKRGLIQLSFTSDPYIKSGSVIDVNGIIYLFESNTTIDNNTLGGEVFIKFDGTDVEFTTDSSWTYDAMKRGYYYSDGFRAIAHFKNYGSWELFTIMDDKYDSFIIQQKYSKMLWSASDSTRKRLTSPATLNLAYLPNFGNTVASYGDYIAVQARYEGSVATAGRVYLFDAKTGSLLRTFNTPSPENQGKYGNALALFGDYLVVGAPGEEVGAFWDAGKVYIYKASTGTLLRTLTSPNGHGNGSFGTSVSVYEDNLLIGASGESIGSINSAGRAYKYSLSSGSLLHTFQLSSPVLGDVFGIRVSISKKYIVISSIGLDPGGVSGAGGVFVYRVEDNSLLHSITSPNPEESGRFGDWLDTYEDKFIVSTYAEGTNGGRAYCFDSESGDLLHTFESTNPISDGGFGICSSIWGDYILIGAYREHTTVVDSGRVYIFSASTGELLHTITSDNKKDEGEYGYRVSISNNYLIVGAGSEAGVTAGGFAYYQIIP